LRVLCDLHYFWGHINFLKEGWYCLLLIKMNIILRENYIIRILSGWGVFLFDHLWIESFINGFIPQWFFFDLW
jgi:hypothetical protein